MRDLDQKEYGKRLKILKVFHCLPWKIIGLMSAFVFIIAGCVSTPEYSSDPLAGIQKVPVNPIFSTVKLALIYSENTRKTIKHLQGMSGAKINFFIEKKEDYNPHYVTKGLHRILNDRFREVIQLASIEEAKIHDVDMVVVFDFRFHQGMASGHKTSVELSGIFMSLNRLTIETIRADGYATNPYPYNVSLKPAANSALITFSQRLDKSKYLLAELKRRASSPDLAKTQPGPPLRASTQLPATDIPSEAGLRVDRWAVIIGISEYKYANREGLTNLIYADDDARSFADILVRLGWKRSRINLLVNEKATERNIKIALESWLTKAGPNDQVVLFWASHGFPDPEDPEKVYFACYDTDISIPATGYRMDKVRAALEERKARNVVVLADTCHAGKLITRGGRGVSIVPQIDKMRREKMIPKGWIFMVGADTDRKAIEHTSWTNGAFTYSLIKGLSGKADGFESVGPKDGVVTMAELRAYLNTAMPDETQKVLGVAKRPIITTSTGDPDIWNLTLQAK